jgi:hypothetical protein
VEQDAVQKMERRVGELEREFSELRTLMDEIIALVADEGGQAFPPSAA